MDNSHGHIIIKKEGIESVKYFVKDNTRFGTLYRILESDQSKPWKGKGFKKIEKLIQFLKRHGFEIIDYEEKSDKKPNDPYKIYQ